MLSTLLEGIETASTLVDSLATSVATRLESLFMAKTRLWPTHQFYLKRRKHAVDIAGT
jgi:hypothetical protein